MCILEDTGNADVRDRSKDWKKRYFYFCYSTGYQHSITLLHVLDTVHTIINTPLKY